MKILMSSIMILLMACTSAFARERVKVFSSQKGLPLKRVVHEFVLSTSNTAQLTISDGDTAIAVSGRYRYSFNPYLQIEGRLNIASSDFADLTAFGGGALYNFAGKKIGNQYFVGGGVYILSGDADDTRIYLVGGKRFAFSRHMSYSPYAEVTIPSDSDFDTAITLIPLSISALF